MAKGSSELSGRDRRAAKLKKQLHAAIEKKQLGRAAYVHALIKKEFPDSRRANTSFDDLVHGTTAQHNN